MIIQIDVKWDETLKCSKCNGMIIGEAAYLNVELDDKVVKEVYCVGCKPS